MIDEKKRREKMLFESNMTITIGNKTYKPTKEGLKEIK